MEHKITDSEKNPLAIFKDDFNRFIKYIETNNGETDIRKLARSQLLTAITHSGARLIKAFSPENLEKQVLDIKDSNKNQSFTTTAGVAAIPGQTYCLTELESSPFLVIC